MLERLTRDFRELLKQLERASCPMCGVLERRERGEVTGVGVPDESRFALCRPHLEMTLSGVASPALRARRARAAIESALAGESGCEVCARLSRTQLRLARAIRRLDPGIRFAKALEAAPAFCRRHARAINDGQVAGNFAPIQRAKIAGLRDTLAQAELRNGDDLESLISAALAYLGRPVERQPPPEVAEALDDEAVASQELERWDETRRVKRLAELESEVASLRYRNAVLSEENRRLRLAYVAGEAMLRDLGRDRAQLGAAADDSAANPPKSPTPR